MKFEQYHPLINLLFFALVIAATVLFNHPIFLALSYACSFAYSVKLNGVRGLVFNLLFIFALIAFWFYYISFNHFGVTPIAQNIIDNSITLESLVYGVALSATIGAVIMWLECFVSVFSTDKVGYVLGGISPKLALYFSIILRTQPGVKRQFEKVSQAQKTIGRGLGQGHVFRRARNAMRIVSIVCTWTLDDLMQTSSSMKNRGYVLKKHTRFSIYRFDNRDRVFVTAIFWLSFVLLAGIALDQTSILYNPMIVFNKITPMSAVFYIAYFCLCLLPFAIELRNSLVFKKLVRKRVITITEIVVREKLKGMM